MIRKFLKESIAELSFYLILFALYLLLPYSLLLLPLAAIALWYFWRPRRLHFSVAALFWATTLIAMYFAFVVTVLRR